MADQDKKSRKKQKKEKEDTEKEAIPSSPEAEKETLKKHKKKDKTETVVNNVADAVDDDDKKKTKTTKKKKKEEKDLVVDEEVPLLAKDIKQSKKKKEEAGPGDEDPVNVMDRKSKKKNVDAMLATVPAATLEPSTSYVPGMITSLFAKDSNKGESDSLFSRSAEATVKATRAEQSNPKEDRKRAKKGDVDRKSSSKKVKKEADDVDEKQDDDAASSSGSSSGVGGGSDDEDEDRPNTQGKSNNDERDERTVFIGNVPVKAIADASEDEKSGQVSLKKLEKALKKEFAKYGRVESVRLRSIPLKSVKVPTGSDYRLVRKVAVAKGSLDDRIDTCNAFVVYTDAEAVAAAVEKADGCEFLGNHLRVDAVRENAKGKVYDRKRTVFVGNLVFEASEEECRAHFVQALGVEAVKSVRIVRDPATNLGRGFAYVMLTEESLVPNAIKLLNDTKIRKRAIRVTNCERSSSKKDAKNEKKFADVNDEADSSKQQDSRKKKPFAGKMATDPKEMDEFSRRKRATLAQRSASSHKKKKPHTEHKTNNKQVAAKKKSIK